MGAERQLMCRHTFCGLLEMMGSEWMSPQLTHSAFLFVHLVSESLEGRKRSRQHLSTHKSTVPTTATAVNVEAFCTVLCRSYQSNTVYSAVLADTWLVFDDDCVCVCVLHCVDKLHVCVVAVFFCLNVRMVFVAVNFIC
eukprot:m.154921 g.154921  ORF g.154921 m.154921 type:complete len:139 (+) comp14303_c0_seq5:1996-2412(+)